MNFFIRLLLNIIIILLVAYIVPGIYVSSIWGALIVAIVLGVINLVLKPILIVLTLPINIITLGLFTFVINGFLLYFVSFLVGNFMSINSFLDAIIGALLISILNFFVTKLEKQPGL